MISSFFSFLDLVWGSSFIPLGGKLKLVFVWVEERQIWMWSCSNNLFQPHSRVAREGWKEWASEPPCRGHTSVATLPGRLQRECLINVSAVWRFQLESTLHKFTWKLTLQSYSGGKGTRVVSRHNWDWTLTNSETSVTFRSPGEASRPLPEGKYCHRQEHKALCMPLAERSSPVIGAGHSSLCVLMAEVVWAGTTPPPRPPKHEWCFWGPCDLWQQLYVRHCWHRRGPKDRCQPAE